MKNFPSDLEYFINDILKNKSFKFRKMFWSYWIYYEDNFFWIYENWDFYIKKWLNNDEIFVENWKSVFTYTKLWKPAYLKNYLKLKSDFFEDSEKITEIFIKSFNLK